MTDDVARLLTAFQYIDEQGGPVVVARAELMLGNGEAMTISAGGGLVTASPPAAPFTHYEVILDHEPARFWRRFTDDDRLLYSNVPQLLVSHHVIRHGGLISMSTEAQMIDLAPARPKVRLPIRTIDELAAALSDITGMQVSKDALIW